MLAARQMPESLMQDTVLGLSPRGHVRRNLPAPQLYEETTVRKLGRIARTGSLVVDTRPYTGRSPKDKFIVRDADTGERVAWGSVNQAFDAQRFAALQGRLCEHLAGQPELHIQDLRAGADPRHQLPIRVLTECPWAALFARNLFLQPDPALPQGDGEGRFSVLHAPLFRADPSRDGTRSEAFVVLDFSQRLVLIGGTSYAGEIKKSIFTVMNYLLPRRGVMPMHCSANCGRAGDVALFFGLSGTGKTTLSADPERRLIGDDEHGWSDEGVFNFEGGCYAKVIKLNPEHEPEIFAATCKFGTVLENVVLDEATRSLDLDSAELTENTRAAYPLSFLPNVMREGRGAHPKNIVFLTADAFGVLPPIARLSPEQAMYYFLSGYTAKVAGTERGVSEPQATFSACFGEPFLPLPPRQYASMLGERIRRFRPQVWLLNTGWTGGPYGVGRRIPIPYTRAMVRAVLGGTIDPGGDRVDPQFGLSVPRAVPDVPEDLLSPRATWSDPRSYEAQARKLAEMFRSNFERYAAEVPDEIKAAAPRL
jgi:phosphoenolpyruvate carboxykinase (ATP)